ncbi:MAG TPA: putative Ig domain-containing protein [Spirosoma sp.]|nr:putative Ig domain-containing protein [Spirosoma sp.]
MHRTCTALKKYVPTQVLFRLGLLLCLFLPTSQPSPAGSLLRTEPDKAAPPGSAAYAPDSYWGPLRLKLISMVAAVANDPIRFSVQASRQTLRLGEPLELTITAELLNISPNLLFFQPGANAYTLRMLLPPGFEQTGGDFTDNVTGTLFYPARPLMSYRIQGYFRSVTAGTSFRLLRGQPGQGDQGLFVEKAVVSLRTELDQPAVAERPGSAGRGGSSVLSLYVLADKGSVGGATRVAAASYKGFLDGASCETVSGWIMDDSNPKQSQQVDIYLDGVKAATLLANQSRQDVANAYGIRDFNAYGYVWMIPSSYKANASLRVSVRPAGTSTELSQSPQQTAICPGTGVPAPTPPATTTVTPPATTTTGGPLTLLAPTYNCTTGAITFNTSGGDGTPIRFRASGITDWTTNPNQYLDEGSRVNADTPPFTIYAEQSGRTVTYIWSRQTHCASTTAPPTSTTTAPPTSTTVAPPTSTTVAPPTSTTTAPPTSTTVTPPTSTTTAPPTTGFAITGVNTVSCETISAGLRRVTFTPLYSGLNGQAVTFSVVGLMAPTTSPAPYTLSIYTDNPTITLQAQQSGTTVSYAYNWLAACNSSTTTPPANRAPVVAQPISAQTATVGQPFSLAIPPGTFSDPEGQPLTYSMSGVPAGLSFSGSTLSGTPTTAGQSTLTLTATDPGNLQATTSFGLTISAPTSTTVAPPTSTTVTPPTTVTVTPPATTTVTPPTTVTSNCTNFEPGCSGNVQEVITVLINVATAGNYPLIIGYRSNERSVDGLVGINGAQQTVRFNHSTVFTTVTIPSVALRAGQNTIALSTGAGGGYLCFNSVCVGTPPPPPSCNFTISANTLNATCNQPGVKLVATCTGTDCGDVSYNWSGNGLSYNGQTVYFDAPSSNGTFTYTVTASRMGCADKTATGTINVSGCGTTPAPTNCTMNDYSSETDITYKP